jgi:hypothetical protein
LLLPNWASLLPWRGRMPEKPKKRFDKLGYGALALYVALMGGMGLAIYGINITSIIMNRNESDRARAQVQSGRMLITTADRTQCRSMRFDNETAELDRETMIDCDAARLGSGTGSSLSILRNGFNKR